MIQEHFRRLAAVLTATALLVAAPGSVWAGSNDRDNQNRNGRNSDGAAAYATTTPIKHAVVIFQENISFDHYFGTYPYATNPTTETPFQAKENTPTVNNLLGGGLLTENPNSTQPFRMDPTMSVTCDQNHSYGPEQTADDHGLMDRFPESTGSGNPGGASPCNDYGKGTGVVMGYFDGNTVTGLWNYAQHYAMSDNSYSTMFGPSTVGALNLIAGTTTLSTLQPSADGSKAVPTPQMHWEISQAISSAGRPSAIPGLSMTIAWQRIRQRASSLRKSEPQSPGRTWETCLTRRKHYLGLVPGRFRSHRARMRTALRFAARTSQAWQGTTLLTLAVTTFRTTNLSSISLNRPISTTPVPATPA